MLNSAFSPAFPDAPGGTFSSLCTRKGLNTIRNDERTVKPPQTGQSICCPSSDLPSCETEIQPCLSAQSYPDFPRRPDGHPDPIVGQGQRIGRFVKFQSNFEVAVISRIKTRPQCFETKFIQGIRGVGKSAHAEIFLYCCRASESSDEAIRFHLGLESQCFFWVSVVAGIGSDYSSVKLGKMPINSCDENVGQETNLQRGILRSWFKDPPSGLKIRNGPRGVHADCVERDR